MVVSNVGLVRVKSVKRDNPYCDDGLCKQASWGYEYGDAGAMGEREGDGSVYANPHANPSADAAMYVEIGDPSSVSPASSAAYFDVVPHDDDDLYMTTAGAADATDANVNAASPGSDNSFWQ